jgi:RHS repeat-associated protein
VQNYTYVYDRYGNRWQQNALQGGSSPSVSFNTATNQINTSGYSYDAAGNMANDSFSAYTFDAEGNIVQVNGGSTAQYVYNALNQRVRAVVGSTTTEYVFNAAAQRVSEWNGTTRTITKGKYYLGTKPVAYHANGAAHFEHQDWLGTERMRTAYNYNSGVEGTFASLPFGDGQAISGTDGDANHYATLDHDSETGTDHAQFRQYSNAQGRWLSPDPYSGSYSFRNPQSFNRYSYSLNNPITLIDPLGLHTVQLGNCLYDVVSSYVDGNYQGDDWEPIGCISPGGGIGGSGGNGSGNGGGGAGGGSAPSNGRQPNKITCGTVLPNGQTVGSYVNQLSNQINNAGNQSVSTPYGPASAYTPGLSPLSIPGAVYSGTNFRQMFGGPGANYALLGDAGNFAYAAVSANIGVPLWATEAAAGAYSVWAHPSSDWVGPWGMDPSATVQVPAGYGASCKNP